ncbi:MAG: CYTH domain-containing protein [Muribaculaceae bacterium]|nr:CYTH domain-containing protein [Muribaculaceae bacterium]
MKEIERKYMVISDSYKDLAINRFEIKQWYLSRDKNRIVRVRIRDKAAFLTIKGATYGIERDEFEYRIPVEDALSMLPLADGRVIEKTRYIVDYSGHKWEVDEFHGSHQGLVLAEIELESADEAFDLPHFAGKEVSDDPRYFNSSLANPDS